MRECARFAIDQISASDSTLQIVFDRAEQSNGLSRKALHAVIRAGGVKAITAAIELIGRTNSLKIRKKLSTILGGLGEAAVPALLDLMNDPRWFIKRNICSILGAIASSESLPTLVTCLHHSDLRVRKEAIRSLALLGVDGEDAILNILRSDDVALYPQAIASLGGMRSKKSLVELMKMVCSRDTFLKSLAVKIDALAAIALIGDRQVTPILVKLLEGRHLLAAARGRELKSAVAACLGRLGDHRALPVLAKLASGGGKLARACLDAKLLIEKTERAPDGIS
jgi:HEAT repeat protein